MPEWETIQIRLRASLALGQQRLDGEDIAGWKPADAAAISARKEETKRKALESGTWAAKFDLVLDPAFGDLTARDGGVLDARSSPVKGKKKVDAEVEEKKEGGEAADDTGKGKGKGM